jgi:membrane protein
MNKKRRFQRIHPRLLKLIQWAKRVTFPGFEGVPVFYVIKFFFDEIKDGSVTMRAASVSFFFVLALFPGIIFFFNMIPYIPIPDFQATLFNLLSEMLPDSAFVFLKETITDIIETQRIDLLSIGFLFAFYFSTQGIEALTRAFQKDKPIFRKRSFLKHQWVIVKLTFILFVLLVVTIGLIVLGKYLIYLLVNWIDTEQSLGWSVYLLEAMRWTVIILTFFLSISIIYSIAPATNEPWRFFSIGSTVATTFSIVSTIIFSFLVNNYNLYNSVYGSIGALIMILVWIYFNSIILILGFELNASIKYSIFYRKSR